MADAAELKDNTASEAHVKIYREREVGIQKVGEQFIFPLPNGSIAISRMWSESSYFQPESILFEFGSRDQWILGEKDDGSHLANKTTR